MWFFLLFISAVVCVEDPFDRLMGPSSPMENPFDHDPRDCIRNPWLCSAQCRVQYVDQPRVCAPAGLDDKCLGMPVRYAHVYNKELGALSKYSILRQFPRCWSLLAPMICLTTFRPCTTYTYMEKKSEHDAVAASGIVEFHQRLAQQDCLILERMCPFPMKSNLFPEFRCDVTEVTENIHQQPDGMFSKDCEVSSSSVGDVPYNSSTCMWPLVFVKHTYAKATPVTDRCYMPCRSPLFTSERIIHSSQFMKMVWCLCCAALFISTYLFASWKCNPVTYGEAAYCVVQSFLHISFYCLLWSLTGIPSISHISECEDDIRVSHLGVHTDWCYVSAVLTHICLLNAYFWLIASIMFNMGVRTKNMKRTSAAVRRNKMVLHVIFLITSVFYSLSIGVFRENNGISGTCIVGASSISGYFLLILPIIVCAGMCALVVFASRRRLQENVRTAAYKTATDAMHENLKSVPLHEEESGDALSVQEKNMLEAERLEHQQAQNQAIYDSLKQLKQHEMVNRIFHKYTIVAIIISIFASLFFGAILHWFTLSDWSSLEKEGVLDMMSCTLRNANNFDSRMFLKQDDHTFKDPYDRIKHSEGPHPDCPLVVYDSRLVYSLVLFNILLLIPFLICAIRVALGLAGVCESSVWAKSLHKPEDSRNLVAINVEADDEQSMLQPPRRIRREGKQHLPRAAPSPVNSVAFSEPADITHQSTSRVGLLQRTALHRNEMMITERPLSNAVDTSSLLYDAFLRDLQMRSQMDAQNVEVSELVRAVEQFSANCNDPMRAAIYVDQIKNMPISQRCSRSLVPPSPSNVFHNYPFAPSYNFAGYLPGGSTDTHPVPDFLRPGFPGNQVQPAVVPTTVHSTAFSNFRFPSSQPSVSTATTTVNVTMTHPTVRSIPVQNTLLHNSTTTEETAVMAGSNDSTNTVLMSSIDEHGHRTYSMPTFNRSTAPKYETATSSTSQESDDELEYPQGPPGTVHMVVEADSSSSVSSCEEQPSSPQGTSAVQSVSRVNCQPEPQPGPSTSRTPPSQFRPEAVVSELRAVLQAFAYGHPSPNSAIAEQFVAAIRQDGSISPNLVARLCAPAEEPTEQGILGGALVSRMFPNELQARVECIRALSTEPMHNMEVYYLLALADVVWEWRERELVPGDIVFTAADIRDILGQGAPAPPGLTYQQMCEIMQRRAFAIAGEVGLVFSQRVGGREPRYAPERLRHLNIIEVCGPEAIEAALHGDISAMRDAMRALNPSVAHIMMDAQNPNGQLMRYFREYLDARAAAIGHPLRPDAYIDRPNRFERNEDGGQQESGIEST